MTKTLHEETVWLYEQSADQKNRFLLGKWKANAEKILLCCGVNPSRADLKHSDPTMKRVEWFAEALGYDGYVMINLCSIRDTSPNALPQEIEEELIKTNLQFIETFLASCKGEIHIWAAWGNLIEKRAYLKACFQQMVLLTEQYPCRWYKLGDVTKKGHPRHPLYLRKTCQAEAFDIVAYRQKLFEKRNCKNTPEKK